MNVFYTSPNQAKCARDLDDKRVVKMVLETAQILSTAASRWGAATTYKPTHKGHPCVVWAGNSKENYVWALKLFEHLSMEYTYRYGKQHKSFATLNDELCSFADFVPPGNATTPPACTPGVEFGTTIARYRAYMCHKWTNDKLRPVWTNRGVPKWADNESVPGMFKYKHLI